MRLLLQTLILLLFSSLPMHASAVIPFPVPGSKNSIQPDNRPLLQGTFIQLLERNGTWNKERWEKLFDTLQALGLRQIVVQWTLLDNRAFYVTQTFEQVSSPPLETILELADSRGIEVYLGLAADSCYWEMIKQPIQQRSEYLKRLRWKSERVAQEMALVATKHPSFKGWYIPEEIDDLAWRSPQSREQLYGHLTQLSAFLKKLTPGGMVLLSGFSSAHMNPASYEVFWRSLLREASVDMLLFQDGTGTNKLSGELLPHFLRAVRSATDANGKRLQVVVELFTMTSESPFTAMPAPISRIMQQLQSAHDYATGGITSFSVPDYMSLEGGSAATELLKDYQKYKGGGLLTTP